MSSEPVKNEVHLPREPSSAQDQSTSTGVERMQSTTPQSSPLSSPPSSPPVVKQRGSEDEMPPPSRKRSHEDMRDERENAIKSSATAVGDVDLTASQVKPSDSQTDSSATALHNIPANTSMAPPPNPTLNMQPPSQKPSRSGQGTVRTQTQQSHTSQPEKASNDTMSKLVEDSGSSDTIPDDGESAGTATPSEPQDRIEDFDWEDLQRRYHSRMHELNDEERAIFDEFDALCNASHPCPGCRRFLTVNSTSASGPAPLKHTKWGAALSGMPTFMA